MSLDSFLMSFGYIGVLVGAIFEGETILVVAGLAIHAGYLHMPGVFLCAFIGAMVGDTLFFCLVLQPQLWWHGSITNDDGQCFPTSFVVTTARLQPLGSTPMRPAQT